MGRGFVKKGAAATNKKIPRYKEVLSFQISAPLPDGFRQEGPTMASDGGAPMPASLSPPPDYYQRVSLWFPLQPFLLPNKDLD